MNACMYVRTYGELLNFKYWH